MICPETFDLFSPITRRLRLCPRKSTKDRRAAVVSIGRGRGDSVSFLWAGPCSTLLPRRAPRCSPLPPGSCAGRYWPRPPGFTALAVIEPLHGLTFALLHLTCMRLLAESVLRHLAATASTLYGTVGIGAATALLTLASGPLFGRFGAHGFWVMAALCAAALPLARTLREPTGERT